MPELTVVDICNSHLTHLVRGLSDAERAYCGELAEVVEAREEVYAALQAKLAESPGQLFSRVDVKKMVLAATYGGSFRNLYPGRECPPWLERFQACIRRLATERACQFPRLMEQLRENGKRDPVISLLSYLVMQEQRKTVDAMAALVPVERHFSYERDGFGFWGEGPSKEDFANAAGMPVTMESYPSAAGIRTWAEERYPYIDWGARSAFDGRDVKYAHSNAAAALLLTNDKGEPKVPRNHSDFATVVAGEPVPQRVKRL